MTPYLTEVAHDVFAYIQPDGSWYLNNCGVVGGGLAIDTCATERRTRDFVETVRSATGRTPHVLLNTHHHGDHTNGNCLMPDATVIGHERCREEILAAGILRVDDLGLFEPVEWGELTPAPPTVTFTDRLDVWVGDLQVELHHLTDEAHTTNDVVAWIPERKVLFTGDLVLNGGTPFVLMGSVAGSLAALDKLAGFDAETLVPGHGAPGTRDLLKTPREYLLFVQDLAAKAHAAGLSPLEAAREADLSPFAQLAEGERLAGNLHRAYTELGGPPVDLLAAFGDMIQLNGGRPLRCRA